jgi:NAD-dependent SIR2 family protein deacetylase
MVDAAVRHSIRGSRLGAWSVRITPGRACASGVEATLNKLLTVSTDSSSAVKTNGNNMKFGFGHESVSLRAPDSAHRLAELIAQHPRMTILTGAGCSTASGIPDYRDDDGRWKHREPMRYAQFVRELGNRQRYWAQSFSGWQRISRAKPNAAHRALSAMENRGHVSCLVTQNVDGLHQRAGSRQVIDLHGVLHRVRCLGCEQIMPRDAFQQQLQDANPDWRAEVRGHAPDGDTKLSRQDFESFVVPDCPRCGGVLKPDVVFFGESVPKDRVDRVHQHVEESDALLVIGSSLMVYSGYRFAVAARGARKPLVIVNRGTTRADDLATHKLCGDCADILPRAIALMAS